MFRVEIVMGLNKDNSILLCKFSFVLYHIFLDLINLILKEQTE